MATPNAAEGVRLLSLPRPSSGLPVTVDAWDQRKRRFPDGGMGSTNYLTAGTLVHTASTNNFVPIPRPLELGDSGDCEN